MPLKTNLTSLFFIIALLFFSTGFSQNSAILLNGKVKYDTVNLKDINIINVKTKIGTVSNSLGEFQINASLGDSILFSSVNFQNRHIVVSGSHLSSKQLNVYLEPGLTELEAIELEQKIRADWGSIAVPRGAILDYDEMSSRTPNTLYSTDPTRQNAGIKFMNIFHGLLSKQRQKKREKKRAIAYIQALQREFPEKIKIAYGSGFFKEWLSIETDQIDVFLDYCEGNGLADFYDKNEMEIKNFLIKQSRLFNAVKKNN